MNEFNQNQQFSDKEYLSKKEQRDRDAETRRKKKMFSNILMWGGVAVVIVGAVYGLFMVAKKDAAKAPGQFYPAQSRDHIEVGAKHDNYNSNPPTGGWHYAEPAQSGIYDKELADEQLIHNLEHGHVWISYRPDLDKASVEKLAQIAKDYGSKIIMTPRAKNDSPIAIMAWQYLLKLDTVDADAINGFIKYYRGHGPEDIPDFGFQDFRGKPLPSALPAMNMPGK